ncbi:hypothetical protein CRUP_004918 [Coryphaenoides rupestris]|nr:hypothetical protein CRUP_004918 [Coryphaenoides rupestris]
MKNGTPKILVSFSEKVVNPSEPVFLACTVKGTPPPGCTWSLDDDPVIKDGHHHLGHYETHEGHVVSQLNVTHTQVQDGGLYRCACANSAGAVHHQARINMISPLRYQDSSYSSEPLTLQDRDTLLPTLPFTLRGLITAFRGSAGKDRPGTRLVLRYGDQWTRVRMQSALS